MTTVATLNAIMRADVGSFVSGVSSGALAVKGLTKEAETASAKCQAAGKSMTTGLTLPILGLAAVAVKMSLDVEQTFTKLQTAVGLSKDEVADFRKQAMTIGPELGIGPKEFGDALFYVTSAGLRGAQALEVVSYAAKASAVGMGEAKTIASTVTSAMNAYATSHLTAKQATDVLVSTIRQGKMAPEELATVLGRLLPVAAAMNISFDQVGGALAVLTRTGFDAAQAATALRAIMTTIEKPSKGAQDALQSVGLSAQQLRNVVANEGLLPALDLLKLKFGDNQEAMFRVFGNVRALSGYLAIVGQDANSVAGVFANTANSVNVADEAFKQVSETAGFKMKSAWAEVQVALVSFGDVLLPIVAGMANGIGDVAKYLGSLSGASRTAAVSIGLIAAAIGPVLVIGTKLVTLVQNMAGRVVDAYKAIPNLIAALNNMNTAAALTSVGLAAAAAGLAIWVAGTAAAQSAGRAFTEEQLKPMNDRLSEGHTTIRNLDSAMAALNGVIASNGQAMDGTTILNKKYKDELTGQNEALRDNVDKLQSVKDKALAMASVTGKNADAYAQWLQNLDDGGKSYTLTEEAIAAYNKQALIAAGSSEANATQVAAMGDKYAEAKVDIEESNKALQDWEKAIKAQLDPLWGMLDAVDKVDKGQQSITKAQTDYNTALREHGAYSAEAKAAYDTLKNSQDAMLKTNYELDIAAQKLAQSVQSGNTPLSVARDMIDSWTSSGRISAAQADEWKNKLLGVVGQADKIAGHAPLSFVMDTRGIDNANAKFQILLGNMNEVDRKKALSGVAAVNKVVDGMRAGGGPALAGHRYIVGERGPEVLEMGGQSGNVMSNQDAFGGGMAGGFPSTVILRVGSKDIVAALVQEDHGQL